MTSTETNSLKFPPGSSVEYIVENYKDRNVKFNEAFDQSLQKLRLENKLYIRKGDLLGVYSIKQISTKIITEFCFTTKSKTPGMLNNLVCLTDEHLPEVLLMSNKLALNNTHPKVFKFVAEKLHKKINSLL